MCGPGGLYIYIYISALRARGAHSARDKAQYVVAGEIYICTISALRARGVPGECMARRRKDAPGLCACRAGHIGPRRAYLLIVLFA